MEKTIHAAIFDFNGTLVLDHPYHVKAWSQISRQIRGRDITEEELHTKMNGKCNVDIVGYLSNGTTTKEEAEEISLKKEALYRQIFEKDHANFHLVQGAERLFDDLKAEGIPFTIASASIKPNIDFFVKSFHLDHWIDPAMIVYDDGLHADKVSMFRDAAKNLNMPLDQITVFEDSITGIQAALDAGVQDIRILDSANVSEQLHDLPQIRQIVHNFDDITR